MGFELIHQTKVFLPGPLGLLGSELQKTFITIFQGPMIFREQLLKKQDIKKWIKVFFTPQQVLNKLCCCIHERQDVFLLGIKFLKNGSQPSLLTTCFHREEVVRIPSVITDCGINEAPESNCEKQEALSRITEYTDILFFIKNVKKH